MKTSNKLLIGFIGSILVAMLISNIIVRANLVPQESRENRKNPQVELTGKTVKDTRYPGDFDELKVSDRSQVILIKGDSPSLEIETDEALLPFITSEVKDGKLRLSTKAIYEGTSKTVYRLTYKEIKEVEVSGSSKVSSNDIFQVPSLGLYLGGNGQIDFQVEADHVEVKIGGSGKANLSGSAGHLKGSVGEKGEINALALETKSADVSLGGSGDISVWSTGRLDIQVEGNGTVKYKGGTDVHKSIGGGGDIIKLDE